MVEATKNVNSPPFSPDGRTLEKKKNSAIVEKGRGWLGVFLNERGDSAGYQDMAPRVKREKR